MIVKPKRKVSKVYIHCSASDVKAHDNVRTIRRWHLARGFAGTGYHLVITRNGIAHNARGLEFIPAAQKGKNTGSIAICVTGFYEFTAEQMFSLIRTCTELDNLYARALTFHGHCEVANKSCPVFDYRAVLALDSTGHMRRG